ncbi:hypothetical protein EDD15DRAFT_2518317 [Pisolithus albus]|nr:hypothetical protein EDD15DRAFT_2518317 [Pisolithus albus]
MSRNADTATTSPSIPTPSISTGEQTANGIPSEAFEALIDLSTSDGIDDPPPASTVPRVRVMADGAALRDESGRLDFEKICSMSEEQSHAESQGGPPIGAVESDQRAEDTVTLKANPVTSAVQDSRPDRSGYPDVDGAVPSNDAPPPRNVPTTPFSFDQLNDALRSARDEMRNLRRQYNELQQLVAGRVVSGAQDSKTCGDATVPSDLRVPATTARDGMEIGPRVAIGGGAEYGPKRDGDGGIAPEITCLTSWIAHRKYGKRWALAGDPGSAPFKSSPCTGGNLSPQDVLRALDFVEQVDEII